LGTITNLSSAKKWLRGTFLYVRLRENPEHYQLDPNGDGGSLEDRLERICIRDMDLLRDASLIKGDTTLISTEFGDAAARYGVHFDTAKAFLNLPPKAKLSEIVSVAFF
jgi:ATP-dependent DNA helicase HFM1/MER3